jgi:hypothetical protein
MTGIARCKQYLLTSKKGDVTSVAEVGRPVGIAIYLKEKLFFVITSTMVHMITSEGCKSITILFLTIL